jgi:pyruvate kinase
VIEGLIREGMDVARLNFSHGSHDFHRTLFGALRTAADAQKRNVGILQDLQGPKLRVGKLAPEGVELKAGQEILLYPEGDTPGALAKGRIALPIVKEIALPISKDLQKGSKILFDDGKLLTRVVQLAPPEIVIEVEVGGHLTSNKGINLPGTPLSLPSATDKDLKDLKLGLDLGVDAIALSFVRKADDIEKLRREIRKQSNHMPLLVSKIEREEAVDDFESILEVSDGLLIARGDMAVELGADRVPVIQKRLIHACASLGVPVITATQMLESMIQSPTPTRAEASDVANAVFDGTDAVMLSGETAAGKYPLEAVRMMSKIILGAQDSLAEYTTRPQVQPLPGSAVDSIEYSASKIAFHVGASAVACLTHSGMAARTLSKYRPETPIVAIMDSAESLRKLSFVWGVQGVIIPKILATDDLFAMVEKVLTEAGLAHDGDWIVVTAGVPTLRRGTTNMVKVHQIGAPIERPSRRL